MSCHPGTCILGGDALKVYKSRTKPARILLQLLIWASTTCNGIVSHFITRTILADSQFAHAEERCGLLTKWHVIYPKNHWTLLLVIEGFDSVFSRVLLGLWITSFEDSMVLGVRNFESFITPESVTVGCPNPILERKLAQHLVLQLVRVFTRNYTTNHRKLT